MSFQLVVQLGPKPWHKRWDRYTEFLSGYVIKHGYLDERTLRKLDNFNSYLSAVSVVSFYCFQKNNTIFWNTINFMKNIYIYNVHWKIS